MLRETTNVFPLSFEGMKDINEYKKEFVIPGIDYQTFPVYAIAKTGRLVNFKNIVYPNPKSAKRFTRRKQLVHRSLQARMFDMLINIGYFDGLGEVVKEMPVLIENSKRPEGLKSGLFWLLDYYFQNIRVAVELDSEYHDDYKDSLRDKYLSDVHGITVFRMRNLQLESVQRGRFLELKKLLQSCTPTEKPIPLIMTNDLYNYLGRKK